MLRCSDLISFILIFIRGRTLEFHCGNSLTLWHIIILKSRLSLKLILREVVFITWCSIERNLHFLICCLRKWFILYSRWFNILRFIWWNALKFHLRRSIYIDRWLLYFLLSCIKLLWIVWLDYKWLILILIRTASNKWHMVQNFTLLYIYNILQHFLILKVNPCCLAVVALYKCLDN